MQKYLKLIEEFKQNGDLSKLDHFLLIRFFEPETSEKISILEEYITNNIPSASAYIFALKAYAIARYDSKEAEVYISEAIIESKKNKQSNYVLLAIYRAESYYFYVKGELIESYNALSKGLKLSKDENYVNIHETLIFNKALIYMALGKYQEALAFLMNSLEGNKTPINNESYRKYIALCNIELKNNSAAKTSIDLIFNGNFNDSNLNQNYFPLYLLLSIKKDDYEEATRVYNRLLLIEEECKVVPFLLLLAKARYSIYTKNYLQAYELFKELKLNIEKQREYELNLLNEYSDILYHLNKVHLAYEVKSEAYKILEKNIKLYNVLDPSDNSFSIKDSEHNRIINFLSDFNTGILLQYNPINLITYIQEQLIDFFGVKAIFITIKEDEFHFSMVKKKRQISYENNERIRKFTAAYKQNALTIVKNDKNTKDLFEFVQFENQYAGAAPIYYENQHLGTIYILSDDASVYENKRFDYIGLILTNTSLNIKNTVDFIHARANSEIDHLTGVKNSIGLSEFKLKKNFDKETYLIFFEIINFKQINDEFGHLIGDKILITTANILRKTFVTDNIFRIDESKFLVSKVLSLTKLQTDISEIYDTLVGTDFLNDKTKITIDLTVGGSQIRSYSFKETMHEAEVKLGKAKIDIEESYKTTPFIEKIIN